jgi:hypothetical protein
MTNSLADIVVKATPGPWAVSTGCDQFVCSDGVWIASTMGVKGETGAANAQLIALAPTLATLVLEAREALKAIETAQAATDEEVELIEQAAAEGWDHEPTGSSHLFSARKRADDLWQIAGDLRRATLAKLESL